MDCKFWNTILPDWWNRYPSDCYSWYLYLCCFTSNTLKRLDWKVGVYEDWYNYNYILKLPRSSCLWSVSNYSAVKTHCDNFFNPKWYFTLVALTLHFQGQFNFRNNREWEGRLPRNQECVSSSRWGEWVYRVVAGVTSDAGVSSTLLLSLLLLCYRILEWCDGKVNLISQML